MSSVGLPKLSACSESHPTAEQTDTSAALKSANRHGILSQEIHTRSCSPTHRQTAVACNLEEHGESLLSPPFAQAKSKRVLIRMSTYSLYTSPTSCRSWLCLVLSSFDRQVSKLLVLVSWAGPWSLLSSYCGHLPPHANREVSTLHWPPRGHPQVQSPAGDASSDIDAEVDLPCRHAASPARSLHTAHWGRV